MGGGWRIVEGEEAGAAGGEELEWVDVGGAAEGAPMEAGSRRAVGGDRLEVAEWGAGGEVVAEVDVGVDRFVGGADAAVGDGDDAAAGDHAREGHGAGCGRSDRLAGGGE
ncbi:hypothetical protein GCM10027569_06550 [Flindersiella endophytica]